MPANRAETPPLSQILPAAGARVEFKMVVAYLRETLGTTLVALIGGVTGESVGRWATGANEPPLAVEQRIRDAYDIFRLLVETDAPSTARAWFMGMNPQLDDLSPIEALAEGQRREVLAAARAFTAGA